ncbi:hypothetical protein CPC08DRAFT_425331 [Agrocybe pediades]|nr:hypothetical protein CPC08DRAFT_425331 [Agrocybe pediades]
MGRWTQYDEDEYRLPEGMKRIGYDSDSGRYYFRDSNGSIWKGSEGVQFGEMTRVSNLPSSLQQPLPSEVDTDITGDELDSSETDDTSRRGPGRDLEASPHTRSSGGYHQLLSSPEHRPSTSPYRSLFPFFLIIAVSLLLIWRLLLSPNLTSSPQKRCPEGTSVHWIQPGQTCWEVSRQHGWTLDKFREANPKVVCDPLMPGTSVCLPPSPAKAKKLQPPRRRV